MPELLAERSYDTALIGFQHEHPDPTVLGFGEVHGIGYLPRALPVARETERWLAERARQPDPFFLTVGMWEVHRPWPREDYTHADPEAVTVPGFLPDNAHSREDLAAFYGAIAQLDEAVGQVLDAVDRYCDPANTLVMFTTDHGAAFPGAKTTLYDAGVGVALLVRPPASWGVRPGRSHASVSHLDIVPTVLELAGGAAGAEHEGRSLVGDLLGRAPAGGHDRELFFEVTFHDGYHPMRAVRTNHFKYVRNFTDGPRLALPKDLAESTTTRGLDSSYLLPREPAELYDLSTDPWEQHNIVADPAMAETAATLDRRLTTWMAETRDPLVDGPVSPPPRPTRFADALDDLPTRR